MMQKLFTVIILLFILSGCQKEENRTEITRGNLHPLGAVEESPSIHQKVGYYKLTSSLKSLPTSIDLSSIPDVGDQGTQGSCVGWAVGYYLRTHEKSLDFYWDVNGNAFSPSWIYNQINGGVDQGARISDAMNLVVNKGCDLLSNFPYNQTNYTRQPDAASFARALNYKCDSWQFIQNDVSTFKQILAYRHAFVVGLKVYPDFDALSSTNPIYDVLSGNPRGRHALCIVGYDDAKQAFKFVNSWGKSYGLDGYGWISYNLISNPNLGLEAYMFNPNYLNVTITGPGSGFTGTTLNYSANIISNIGIVQPYTYIWEISDPDAEEWSLISNNSTVSVVLNSGIGFDLRLTIKSANNIVSTDIKHVANKGDGM